MNSDQTRPWNFITNCGNSWYSVSTNLELIPTHTRRLELTVCFRAVYLLSIAIFQKFLVINNGTLPGNLLLAQRLHFCSIAAVTRPLCSEQPSLVPRPSYVSVCRLQY